MNNEEKMVEIKYYKKTFIGKHYEKDGNILVIPKDQFTKNFLLAKPMHGLLLFEPGLVNISEPTNSFWIRCIVTFHKKPRSDSLGADLLSELRNCSGHHISRKTLNETLDVLKLDLLDNTVDGYLDFFCSKVQKEYTDCIIQTVSGSARKKAKPSKFNE